MNNDESDNRSKSDIIRNKIQKKRINACEHKDKPHYAKNLCYNCYHRRGRNVKPWNCPHARMYAQGMC